MTNGVEVPLGAHQPLDEGHRFIIRPIDDSGPTPRIGLIIQIKPAQGKKPVQNATVKFLSAISGPYMIDLDPSQPIFPMETAIEALLSRDNIKWSTIVPMFTDGSYVAPPVQRGMQMVSDGAVERTDLPERDDCLPAVRHSVKDATWAISHGGEGDVHSIFLWNGIADPGKLAELKAALDVISAANS